MIEIHCEDAISFLRRDFGQYDLIVVDPPFNTGKSQVSSRDDRLTYEDSLERDRYCEWCRDWLIEAKKVLHHRGTIYVHLDWHSVFDVKPVMDKVFGRENFLNHVVWSYDYGGRGKDRFPRKHDDILVYAKSIGDHIFNWDEIDRIPYMAPGLQKDLDRAAAGKVPTDVWWMSIVGTNSHERTGYPTQKPAKLFERMIRASSPSGGKILDFFAGSGTTGAAARACGRDAVLVDSNPDAIKIMKERFDGYAQEKARSSNDT